MEFLFLFALYLDCFCLLSCLFLDFFVVFHYLFELHLLLHDLYSSFLFHLNFFIGRKIFKSISHSCELELSHVIYEIFQEELFLFLIVSKFFPKTKSFFGIVSIVTHKVISKLLASLPHQIVFHFFYISFLFFSCSFILTYLMIFLF